MSVHGDDDLYADLYGNDDYAAVEDEILGIKSTSPEKNDTPAEATRPSNPVESTTSKPAAQATPSTTTTFRPANPVPEPPRAAPAPPPQIGSSIATYTSDEGTTLPPTGYNTGYGSLPPSMRPYDPEAEKQPGSYPKPNSSNFADPTQGGAPSGDYSGQPDGGARQQEQDGYANGAVFESSNHTGGFGGGQRGGYGGFAGGGANAGTRRFDSVRPSEMKDEG